MDRGGGIVSVTSLAWLKLGLLREMGIAGRAVVASRLSSNVPFVGMPSGPSVAMWLMDDGPCDGAVGCGFRFLAEEEGESGLSLIHRARKMVIIT